MSDHGSPTVRRRRLAAELHRLRELSGLTGDQVAVRLGWSPSKISRIENIRSGIKVQDASRLLDLYGVQGGHRDDLLALAQEAERKGWWETYSADWPADFSNYIDMEAEAQSISSWEPLVVPGLLQTEAYGRAVIANWQSFTALPDSVIERRVKVRLERQQVIAGDDALRFAVILDESVLHRRFGENSVMNEQLKRLFEESQRPNITLQVLPLGGFHPVCTGAFGLLRFTQVHGVVVPDVVYLENMTNGLYIDDEVDTYYYQRAFDQMRCNSLDPVRSRELILQINHDRWR